MSGSLGAGAVALRRAYFERLRGAPARLAEVVLGLGLLIGVCELLGTAGLLRLGPVVLASVAVGATLRRALPRPRGEAEPSRVPGRLRLLGVLEIGLALAAAGAVLVEWAGPALLAYDRGIVAFDSVWYHLPQAASFAQTGQITALRFTDVVYLVGFYPQTSELLHALGIVLMGTDVLSPAIDLVFGALVLFAAYCVGCGRGVGRATMLGAVVVLATPMMFFAGPGTASDDLPGMFFLLAALALWSHSPALNRRDVVLIGVAAGLAASTKLTLLIPVVALGVGLVLFARSGARLRVGVTWVVSAFVAGGFWYMRNLIAVGNPLPWFSFGGLLPVAQTPLSGHTSFTVADYLFSGRILSHFFAPAMADGLGPWWVVILVAGLVGSLLAIAAGDRLVRVASLVALVAAAAYVVTPNSAAGPWGDPVALDYNVRYAAPGLILVFTAFPLLGWLRGRAGRWLVFGGLTAVLIATLAQGRLWTRGYLGGALPLGGALLLAGAMLARWPSWRRFDPPSGRWLLGVASRRREARRRVGGLARGRRILPAVTLAALLLAGASAGYAADRHYLHGRYVRAASRRNPVTSLWRWGRSLRQQRIGVVGTFAGFFTYPLFGIDGSNRVQYIARHGSHGSFTPITTCRALRTAVNAGDYRYVVTSGARSVWTRNVTSSPEGGWIGSDPAATLLFRAGRGDVVEVFKIAGRLDPHTC